MSVEFTKQLRIARDSDLPEARIQAFHYLGGEDAAYDIFIEALNNRHVGVVAAAISGIAEYDDDKRTVLLDLLDYEEFGYGKDIIRGIIRNKDISLIAEQLKRIIPQRKDALDLIWIISIENQKFADELSRSARKHHNFWEYAKCGFIENLDLKHPVSLGIVKKMLFVDMVSYFGSILDKHTKETQEGRELKSKTSSSYKKDIFGFISTLITLSNRFRMHNGDFDLRSHIVKLRLEAQEQRYSSRDVNILTTIDGFLDLYLRSKIKTDVKTSHVAIHGGQEFYYDQSMDEYIHLDD